MDYIRENEILENRRWYNRILSWFSTRRINILPVYADDSYLIIISKVINPKLNNDEQLYTDF